VFTCTAFTVIEAHFEYMLLRLMTITAAHGSHVFYIMTSFFFRFTSSFLFFYCTEQPKGLSAIDANSGHTGGPITTQI